MKRFMKLMSIVLVLGTVATAEDLGANPEVFVNLNKGTQLNGCDPLKQLLGMCRSSKYLI